MSADAPETLDDALDALDGSGVVDVQEGGHRTRVDVVEAGRLGVKVRSVEVGHGAVDIPRHAERLCEDLRALPDRLSPVEVDATLGGAILRTAPRDMRRGRFFEVEARPEQTGIRRFRVSEDGRQPEPFTLTRDQLRDLVDEVRGEER